MIASHKGSRVVLSLAADALIRELPLRFVIYGHTDNKALSDYPNVRITGPYREDEIDDLLAADPCDLALFPSVCPEAFCYTLDHAIRNGIFPVAFDLGTVAARIRALGFGRVVPLDYAIDSTALNDLMLEEIPQGPQRVEELSRLWRGADDFYSRSGSSGEGQGACSVSPTVKENQPHVP
jgi:glycosyltransferase involved in cell wall biosynthesis